MANGRSLQFQVLEGCYTVTRFSPGSVVPNSIWQREFVSITKTPDEISVVCPEPAPVGGVDSGIRWRAFRIAGTLDFGLTGILASVASTLAEAGVSLFAVSTFDTDWLLVSEGQFPKAVQALTAADHQVDEVRGIKPD